MERSFSIGLRAVDDEPGMHLDGDFHAVIFGELAVLGPVGRHFLLPLPVEQVQIIRRPRARHPVRVFRVVAVAGAAREIDHHGNA